MARNYSMGYLTGNGVDPVTAVRIAAEHGYQMISFRLLARTALAIIRPAARRRPAAARGPGGDA